MKTITGLLACLAVAPLRADDDFCGCSGGGKLLTPGTATCEVIGASTIISMTDNTVIQWDSFSLPSGREMQFNFSNPRDTVVNRVTGTGTTLVGGTINSNGNVVLLSPNSWLLFRNTANVTAGSFTASGLDADPAQFTDGRNEIEFHATAQTNPTTVIRGNITTTRGDVLVVGRELQVVGDMDAAGAVTAVTGDRVNYQRNSPTTPATSGGRQIIQGGTIKAGGDIALVSQEALSMTGEMRAGNGQGRFFAKVNDGGNILIGNAGLVVHARSANYSEKPQGEVAFIPPAEGDNPGALAPALNEFPSLAANRTTKRTVPTSAAITARAGTGFTKAEEQKAKRRSGALAENVAPIRKRSFFRTRATVTQKR
ncbi:filamentous hemagglutinin N-terminal domain-containing protein [Luteolibacter marinus]|uniref:two-partner secretion domain-containing protein n=1 Tax=Luteolibacter marinus TaxID=2776705 RepID=UPI001868877A|nr:filamentous hemagglutinin N-terminal domain-containing protein [Luteolibacter marinus]